MKVVFDTNVLISATMWDNSISHKLLIKLIKEDAEIFTNIEILKEYKKVLLRDFKYSENQIKEIISKLIGFLKIAKSTKKINVIKDDPADNKILECAVSSGANFILSYDRHLLKLKEFNGIVILTPDEFFEKVT